MKEVSSVPLKAAAAAAAAFRDRACKAARGSPVVRKHHLVLLRSGAALARTGQLRILAG